MLVDLEITEDMLCVRWIQEIRRETLESFRQTPVEIVQLFLEAFLLFSVVWNNPLQFFCRSWSCYYLRYNLLRLLYVTKYFLPPSRLFLESMFVLTLHLSSPNHD